jgi:hypothetical protein
MAIDIEKLEDAVALALSHFVHIDRANAAIHGAQVRYSPITFRLAEAIPDLADRNDDVHDVLLDRGTYKEDKGR